MTDHNQWGNEQDQMKGNQQKIQVAAGMLAAAKLGRREIQKQFLSYETKDAADMIVSTEPSKTW